MRRSPFADLARALALRDMPGRRSPTTHAHAVMADEPDAPFYEVTLTGEQREHTLKALRAYSRSGDGEPRKGAIQALELATPTDLPPGNVDWDELEREAEQRGESLVDLAWDRARGKEA